MHAFQFIDPKDGYSQEIVFVTIALVAAFTLTALASFSPYDPSPFNFSFPPRAPQNLCGIVGSYLAGSLIYNLGALAYFLPFPWVWMSLQNLQGKTQAFSKSRICGWILVAVCLLLGGQQWASDLSFVYFVDLSEVSAGRRRGLCPASDDYAGFWAGWILFALYRRRAAGGPVDSSAACTAASLRPLAQGPSEFQLASAVASLE